MVPVIANIAARAALAGEIANALAALALATADAERAIADGRLDDYDRACVAARRLEAQIARAEQEASVVRYLSVSSAA